MAEDNQSSKTDRLSRHGLVMAIWAPAIFVAAVLFHAGYLYAAELVVCRRLYSAGFGVLRAYCRQCGIKNWFYRGRGCARECYPCLPNSCLSYYYSNCIKCVSRTIKNASWSWPWSAGCHCCRKYVDLIWASTRL